LEKAIKLNPDDENARDYYNAIKEKKANQLKEREKDSFRIDDKTQVTIVKTKKTEDYAGLILEDYDNKYERDSKDSKQRKKSKH